MPFMTPSEGSCGVVGTLWMAMAPVSRSEKMRSVNVPPTSTPITFMSREPRV